MLYFLIGVLVGATIVAVINIARLVWEFRDWFWD